MSKSSKIIWAIVLILVLVAASIVLVVYFKKRAGSDNNAEVEYALEEFQYNTEKLAIKSSDEINADLFGATIKGNDGEKVAVTATLVEGSKVGGGEISVKLSATGKGGVKKEKTITGIKVYAEPVVEYYDTMTFIRENNMISNGLFGAGAKDSLVKVLKLQQQLLKVINRSVILYKLKFPQLIQQAIVERKFLKLMFGVSIIIV